ncbi:hypothetical protein C8R44DRAFT_878140 [Mycena epipterygia]|nr:hypothetical protein C8R44DRAFT_878140 [Mycena epipterygia]
MLFRSFIVSALVLVATAESCHHLVCPRIDDNGDMLVEQKGGLGDPLSCGYSADATGASGSQIECYYYVRSWFLLPMLIKHFPIPGERAHGSDKCPSFAEC